VSYQVSQLQWIDQLKEGMNNPTEWYFKTLTAGWVYDQEVEEHFFL